MTTLVKREMRTLVFQDMLTLRATEKINREDAIKAFHTVLQELNIDENIDNGSLVANLSKAYAYLLPGRAKVLPRKKLRNKTAWVAQACSLDASRSSLMGVQVDDEYSVATDGKRLHLIECKACKADQGNFDPKTMKHDDRRFETYPKYKQVIPDYKNIYKNSYKSVESPKMKLLYSDMFIYHVKVDDITISLNAKYVDQALCAVKNSDYTFWYHDQYKSIVITYDEKIAVIMPERN